jgi:hypothetical protein
MFTILSSPPCKFAPFPLQITFKDADAMRKAFNKIKQDGKINGVDIPKDQLDDLGKRISKVVLVAPHVLKKIEYEEVKHRLLGLLDGTDEKLNVWSDRYGSEDEVGDMMDDYKVGRYSRQTEVSQHSPWFSSSVNSASHPFQR